MLSQVFYASLYVENPCDLLRLSQARTGRAAPLREVLALLEENIPRSRN